MEVLIKWSSDDTIIIDTHSELFENKIEVAIWTMLPAFTEHDQDIATIFKVLFQGIAFYSYINVMDIFESGYLFH